MDSKYTTERNPDGGKLHPCKCHHKIKTDDGFKECGQEFQTWAARKDHTRDVHGIKEKRLKRICGICGEEFLTRKHRRTHQKTMAHYQGATPKTFVDVEQLYA